MLLKKMYNLDEETGNRELVFGRGSKPRGIRSIYLSLTLGTAKFNQLD